MSLSRRIIRKLTNYTLKPLLSDYLKKDRVFRYKRQKFFVLSGVFHPGFFFSTKILLGYLEGKNLAGKKLLELGSGTGMLSVFASSAGAMVIATDISEKALQNTRMNMQLHEQLFRIIKSDMFSSIPAEIFDYIIVNPPFYNRNPVTEPDYAWYCGNDFQYFSKFFSGLEKHADENTNVIMILSEDCNIKKITGIAEDNRWKMLLLYSTKNLMERNYIFKIEREQ